MVKFDQHGESQISKVTKRSLHYEKRVLTNEELQETTDMLFSIREPLARFESWFRFMSPHNCISRVTLSPCLVRNRAMRDPKSWSKRFFYNCFQHLEDIGFALDPVNPVYGANVTDPSDCAALLHDGFERVGLGNSGVLTAGYRYYVQKAQLHKGVHKQRVWATRTEHLWDDLKEINRAFGGDDNEFDHVDGAKETRNSELHKDKSGLSKIHQIYVCCALLPDMQAYRVIVEQAENLNASEKVATYQLTWQKCNVTSWETLEERCDSLGVLAKQ